MGVSTFLEKLILPSTFRIILNYFASLTCKVIKYMRGFFLFTCFLITAFYQKVCAVGWGPPVFSDLNRSSYNFVPFRTFYFQSSRKYPNRIQFQSLLAILPVRSWAYSEEGILLPERILSSLASSFFSVQRQKRTLHLDRIPQAMNSAQFKIKNCQSCCALVFWGFLKTGQSLFRGKPVKSCVLADFSGCRN